MSANEILIYLRNEGGFQYFCNNDGWSVKKCVEWGHCDFYHKQVLVDVAERYNGYLHGSEL